MKLTSEERQAMIGKYYQSDMNNADDMAVIVLRVERNGNGYTVIFQNEEDCLAKYLALSLFIKRYPYRVEE